MNPVLICALLIAAGAAAGCRHDQRPRSASASDDSEAEPTRLRWQETPAAMVILQERLTEKRQQEHLVDDRLKTKEIALAEANQRLNQLGAAIHEADTQRRLLQESPFTVFEVFVVKK
jgi:hypothetical protein